MKVKVSCKCCGKEEYVSEKRSITYNACSYKCGGEYRKSLTRKNAVCTNCEKSFHRKESQMKRFSKIGVFCTMKCASEYKRKCYLGENNPNFRGSQYDSNGYRINHYPKVGRVKEHRHVAESSIQRKIPKGFVVHHKDCNIYNNSQFNLCIMSESDHRWIHKQFGNATLWAAHNGKVSIEDICSWSNDIRRAEYLLNLDVTYQLQHSIMSYADYSDIISKADGWFKNCNKIEFIEVSEF